MKITSVSISNFKAIDNATLDLHPTINVLVGANGSGKSSVLQALHWMFQSGRNINVQPRAAGLASTLSELDAIYMPSPDYRSAGHGSEYGNTQGKPQLELKVDAVADDGAGLAASMWLKSARNEGISVHVPTGNQIVTAIRDRGREFSAYIPGVAGIPLIEEKRSKLLVHRSAAAGDANTVLRNILVLLQRVEVNGENGLTVVEKLVSRVMGDFALKVEFNEEKHTRIVATFQTGAMKDSDDRSFRPLELAGIGYLQVLQIFSYLVYFQPVVLLVDEPDAHLYPVAQERLVQVLAEAAATFNSQVLLTTHSPSIVRSLPSESKVIWMKEGSVQPTGNKEGRQLMGWGLLDRKIVLMTEDSRTEMLRAIIAQWPELERVVAIWPFHGSGKLPPPETINGLRALLGDDVRFVIHRDRDFMMPVEGAKLTEPYVNNNHLLWITKYSDIEAYWVSQASIECHFEVTPDEAQQILEEATAEANVDDAATIKRRNKRSEALQKINNTGTLPQFGDADVLNEYSIDGEQFTVLGKSMMASVRRVSQAKGLKGSSGFGNRIPPNLASPLAMDLKDLIESALT
jgi:ABC-type cobalamin/Fe3+-siderophores transport system ATPase subunit